MMSVTEWTVTLPNPASAREGADALTRALDDAHETIREVAGMFSGTQPPPPWPADADLVKAMDRARGIAEGMDVIAKKASDQKWFAGSKPYDAARAAGQEVLARAAALKARAQKLPTAASPADLAATVTKAAAKTIFGLAPATLFWLGVGWVVWEGSKRGRGRRKLFDL